MLSTDYILIIYSYSTVMYWRMKTTFSGKKRKPENHPQNDTIEVKTSLLKVKSI